MDPFFRSDQRLFDDMFEHAVRECAQLRTGRATPAMVEGLMIEAYATKTALKGLASISCPDPRTILIQPWDRSLVKDIERSLGAVGMNGRVSGERITVVLPMPTEQDRKAMVKTLKEKIEASKVSMRKLRDNIRERITKHHKTGELTEDDKYRLYKELDEMVRDLQEKLAQLEGKKEQEILTI